MLLTMPLVPHRASYDQTTRFDVDAQGRMGFFFGGKGAVDSGAEAGVSPVTAAVLAGAAGGAMAVEEPPTVGVGLLP